MHCARLFIGPEAGRLLTVGMWPVKRMRALHDTPILLRCSVVLRHASARVLALCRGSGTLFPLRSLPGDTQHGLRMRRN
jgi:hypothetical protein